MSTTEATLAHGSWTRAERIRLSMILGSIATLHVAGVTLYLANRGDMTVAGGLAGAGTLAYVLGMRHAFDADHIAAIDDTTRIMLLRGRRPVGVGFFFAMGHSTVVVILALVVATAAGPMSTGGAGSFSSVGGVVAVIVAMTFLLVVAGLNGRVLMTLVRLWHRLASGEDTREEVEHALLSRGFVNRLLGGRLRGLLQHSWHMYPVGLLMGLGMETASEITLLALSASTAAAGGASLLAVMSLPLLFAAGMSAFDTADSLIMTRLYSWSYRDPVRTLFFNIATTLMTVVIAVVIASVYLADVLATYAGVTFLSGYGALSERFQVFGFVIAGLFVASWVGAFVFWQRHTRGERP